MKNPPEFKLTREKNSTIDLHKEFMQALKAAWGIEGIARILEDDAVAEDCARDPLPPQVRTNLISGLAAMATEVSEKLDSLYMMLPPEGKGDAA